MLVNRIQESLIPAQAGFYALRHTEGRWYAVPVFAWVVPALGSFDVLTSEGRAEYDALESPDGRVYYSEITREFASRDLYLDYRDEQAA